MKMLLAALIIIIIIVYRYIFFVLCLLKNNQINKKNVPGGYSLSAILGLRKVIRLPSKLCYVVIYLLTNKLIHFKK